MRWDPLDQPGEMVVEKLTFSGSGLSDEIPLSSIAPSVGMGEVVLGDSGASLSLQSNDPQALINAASDQFFAASRSQAVLVSSIVAAVAALAASIVLWFRSRESKFGPAKDLSVGAGVTYVGVERVRLPRWALVSLVIVASTSLIVLFMGSQVIGVSWDEPGHEIALAEFFRSGWFVPRYLFVDGVPDTLAATVYAPVGGLFTHALGVVQGVHPWAVVPLTSEAFAVRHLATAMLAALAILAVLFIARVMLNSWRWAILSAAMLGSLPLFIGHGMFNTKDVAVATGFTIVTLGLVLMTRGVTRGSPWAGIAIAVGAILAVGTRPGIWVALLVSVIATITLVAVMDARQSGTMFALRAVAVRGFLVVFSFVVSYAILWLAYPAAFGSPGTLLAGSLGASAEFAWSGATLAAGVLMPAQPPWTYIPIWLGAQLPLIISGATVVGVVALIAWFVGACRGEDSDAGLVRAGIPILLQASSVPFGAVFLGATLYGGLRQILFVFPAIALLACIGVFAAAKVISRSNRVGWSTGLWIVAVVGLVIPTIAQMRLFPYSFAYFNAIAASRDINGNWDVDGWWLSARELVEERTLPTRVVCAESPPRPLVDCEQLGVVAPYLPASADPMTESASDVYTVLTRYETPLTGDMCRTIGEVSRPLFWQEVRLSSIEECSASLAPYPTGGIVLAGAQRPNAQVLWGWNPHLLWGWGAPEAEGVWTSSSEASLGFVDSEISDSPERQRTLSLTGLFDLPDGERRPVGVFVNGQQVGEVLATGAPDPQSWTFSVSPAALEGLGGGRVIVQFTGLDDLFDDESTGVTGARLRLDSLSLL